MIGRTKSEANRYHVCSRLKFLYVFHRHLIPNGKFDWLRQLFRTNQTLCWSVTDIDFGPWPTFIVLCFRCVSKALCIFWLACLDMYVCMCICMCEIFRYDSSFQSTVAGEGRPLFGSAVGAVSQQDLRALRKNNQVLKPGGGFCYLKCDLRTVWQNLMIR